MTVLIEAITEGGKKATLNVDNIVGFVDEGQDEIRVFYNNNGEDTIRGEYDNLMAELQFKLRHVQVHKYYAAGKAPSPWQNSEVPAH